MTDVCRREHATVVQEGRDVAGIRGIGAAYAPSAERRSRCYVDRLFGFVRSVASLEFDTDCLLDAADVDDAASYSVESGTSRRGPADMASMLS